MNWGTKLIVAMALFMGFIITLSVRMIFSEKDDLVENNYYEKGLHYDYDYNRKKNVERDGAQPVMEFGQATVRIHFKAPSVGTVKFAHSKDRKLDKVFRMISGEGNVVDLPLQGITPGYWYLTFQWKSSGKEYLFEKGVMIQ